MGGGWQLAMGKELGSRVMVHSNQMSVSSL
jgi:hypothetical protein